jgi:serine/threonine protein kinase
MNALERYVGQVLDDKYRLERLLGQGGMGAVYLATHLGTERYVALKLITPQFMRNEEFVERFKREGRAAGRLRHPNVVDVTDFGFARVGTERVAYLVMEYLDGCTLGDVLSEEKTLPVEWVVDILEQVCSAVHEAHQQGIVHRDLKPDNIWLEPNRLGGYRVKVLDFGIAKLAEVALPGIEANSTAQLPASTRAAATDLETDTLMYSAKVGDEVSQQENVMTASSGSSETDTQLFAAPPVQTPLAETKAAPTKATSTSPGAHSTQPDGDKTLMMGQTTRKEAVLAQTVSAGTTAHGAGLTRVGEIMGTPLYMSPEQCRSAHLDARSDVYSLGVIAYQTLAGQPPFTGNMTTVMREHLETTPQDLRERAHKVPKRVSKVVMSALAKDPAARPQTAMAFANAMRANADGLGALYRRAFALYSEYFPKFFKLSLLAHIPVIACILMTIALRLAEPRLGKVATIALAVPIGLLQVVASIVTPTIISCVTAVIVTQLAVAPLKPVELRPAFAVLRRRWRPFLKTGIRYILRVFIGFILFVIPGLVMTVRYGLWGPVVLMEGLEKKAALKRARALASRSWRTIILAMLFQFLVPAIVGGIVAALIGATSKGSGVHVKAFTPLSQLVNIFVLPLMSIVPALLYLKMRQFGGETLNDVMAQIENVEGARNKWQQRMRTRLNVTPQTQTPRSPP